MKTVKGLFGKIVAILILIAIFTTEFGIVGQTLISYAIDGISLSNENVEIKAYFENADGEEVTQIQSEKSKELTLKIDVTVKNERGLGGYFDGKIKISDANFKLKDEEEIPVHTDAGNTTTVEKTVVFVEPENMQEGYLNKNSTITINGEYKNSKQEDKNVSGSATVKVDWISDENTDTEFNMEVLTNKIYTVEENTSRVLQLLVSSKVKDNSYPVKSTKIELDMPEEAISTEVHKRTTAATNGNKEFTDANYEIDNENKKVTITVNNTDMSWKKDVADVFIVTYTIPGEQGNLSEITVNGKQNITLYDDKELEEKQTSVVTEEEVENTVSAEIIEDEKQIYKGKIYSGEERTLKSTTKIYVDYSSQVEKIELEENKGKYLAGDESVNAEIAFTSSTFKKSEIDNLLGEEGYINIKDSEDNTVASINSETEANENGNIIVTYGEGVTGYKIETSKPVKNGELDIVNVKLLKEEDLTAEEIKSIEKIKDEVSANGKKAEAEIGLLQTSTEVEAEMENKNFTSEDEVQNINLSVTLLTNDEDKDLYKDPIIEVILPSQFASIARAGYEAVYANGLAKKENGIKFVDIDGKKAVRIEMQGTQEKYPNEAIEGTIVNINIEASIGENVTGGQENIVVRYTNNKFENAPITGEKEIQINVIVPEEPEEPEVPSAESLVVNTVATVGEDTLKSGDIVKSGEVIKYTTTIKNTSKTDAENVTITGNVPEGTTNVEVNEEIIHLGVLTGEMGAGEDKNISDFEYYTPTDKREVTTTTTVKAGETMTFTYEVKANQGVENGKLTTNTVAVSYNNQIIATSNLTHTLNNGELELTLIPTLRAQNSKLNGGNTYDYILRVKNNGAKKQNVTIDLNSNYIVNILSIDSIENSRKDSMYDIKTFTIGEISANETKEITIHTKANKVENNNPIATLSAIANLGNNNFRSNRIAEEAESVQLNISLTSSNENEYVEIGNRIKYTITVKNVGEIKADVVTIADEFAGILDVESVVLNGTTLQNNKYIIENNGTSKVLKITTDINAGETKVLEINTILPESLKFNTEKEIKNIAKVNKLSIEEEADQIVYKVRPNVPLEQPKPSDSDPTKPDPTKPDPTNPDPTKPDPTKPDPTNPDPAKPDPIIIENKNKISGIAWEDENENGMRELNEKLLEGIEINLIDISTKTFAKDKAGNTIKTKTNKNGEYTLEEIPNGNYIVIFRYNGSEYRVTTYQANDVQSRINSDAVSRKLIVNGEESIVGATDTIRVNGDIANIDLGLVKIGTFDLEISKTVSKIVVNNSQGTTTYNFDNEKLAKAEIAAKHLKGSTVLIDYKITVKNTGTVSGYAKSIVDYYPQTLKFIAEANNGWYQKGTYVYNDSLANEEIKPGEEKELHLMLSIVMTETNAGLINNSAEVADASNIYGTQDIDSTLANRVNGEDDMSMADVIIGIRTGAAISYIIATLTTIISIAVIAYIIYERIIKKRVNI